MFKCQDCGLVITGAQVPVDEECPRCGSNDLDLDEEVTMHEWEEPKKPS